MSRIQVTLSPRETRDYHKMVGEFFYLESATAAIDVKINSNGPVRLQEFDAIELGITNLTLFNPNLEKVQIVFQVGKGKMKPAYTGKTVAIRNFPQTQNVSGQVTVNPSSTSGLPVAIQNYKSVQAVKQSGAFVLTPANGLTAQEIDLTADGATIAEDSKRKSIIVKAGKDNAGTVVIAGAFPLSAGEQQKIETTAAIQISGTAEDKVYLLIVGAK